MPAVSDGPVPQEPTVQRTVEDIDAEMSTQEPSIPTTHSLEAAQKQGTQEPSIPQEVETASEAQATHEPSAQSVDAGKETEVGNQTYFVADDDLFSDAVASWNAEDESPSDVIFVDPLQAIPFSLSNTSSTSQGAQSISMTGSNAQAVIHKSISNAPSSSCCDVPNVDKSS